MGANALSQDADSSTTRTVTIELTEAACRDLERAANSLGLRPEAYLLALHALRIGRLERDLPPAVRAVFTNDREVLRRLAK